MKNSLYSLRMLGVLYFLISCFLFALDFRINGSMSYGLSSKALLFLFMAFLHYRTHEGFLGRKYWAWIASVIFFTLGIFTPFFPYAIMGLKEVLQNHIRRVFLEQDLEYEVSLV